MILPPFKPNVHYREIPLGESQGRWRWELAQDVTVRVPGNSENCVFLDSKNVQWGRLEHRFLTIRRGYWWNGCSPKRVAGGVWLGTPDTQRTMLGSLVHDLLYQASGDPLFPFTRDQCDHLFFRILSSSGSLLALPYYFGVVAFGDWFFARQNSDGLRISPIV